MKKQFLFVTSAALAVLLGSLSGCQKTNPNPGSSNDGGDSSDSSGSIDPCGGAADEGGEGESEYPFSGILRFYYHDDAADYASKRLWVWGVGVGGDASGEVEFDNQTLPDDYGIYKDFDLSSGVFAGKTLTSLSFIVKNSGTWSGQSTDTACPFAKFSSNLDKDSNGKDRITIYAVKAEAGIISTYAVRNSALGDRFSSVSFSDWKTIKVVGTGNKSAGRDDKDIGVVASYSLYAFPGSYLALDEETQAAKKGDYLVKTGNPASNNFNISLDENCNLSLSYSLEGYFASDTCAKKSKIADFYSLYDDATFIKDYTYSGTDLGCTDNEDGTFTFKLWAPTATRVRLYHYIVGTPSALTDLGYEPAANNHSSEEMALGSNGVWSYTSRKGIYESGEYYTYAVTNSEGTSETADPYSTSCGVNGVRSGILSKKDMAATDPTTFRDDIASLATSCPITSLNQMTIYEAHIRDLTADETWVSNKGNARGTYNAFCEEGTTYSENGVTVKTGFDNIKELGVNAIQLLPVFDGDNDERTITKTVDGVTTTTTPSYNWGYNPLNFNSVEGCYSSNPYDLTTRIGEYKNLIDTAAKNDIRIVMDVVYNHLASVSNNAFTKTMPKYYFRTSSDGSYTDGTGVGNETASERIMFSRFIVNSVSFWAKEYGIKGFRFDLMGCIDTTTMRNVKDALYAIDPSIIVYGEGWTGGTSALADSKKSSNSNVYSILYDKGKGSVGAFNDGGRDGLKGNTAWGSVAPSDGFINQASDHLSSDTRNKAASSLIGINTNGGSNPTQTVDYVSCHDNYTLYDQLNYLLGSGHTSAADNADAINTTLAVSGAVLFGQGAAFIQGGEEIFRQKLMGNNDEYYSKIEPNDYVQLNFSIRLVRNSYAYGDAVNSFKYDRKIKFKTAFDTYASMVALRKSWLAEGWLAREYDATTYHAKGATVWGSISDYDGTGYTNPAIGASIAKGAAERYVLLGGRCNDKEVGLKIGSGTCNVLFSSNGYHEAGSSLTLTDNVGIGKYEFLLLGRA